MVQVTNRQPYALWLPPVDTSVEPNESVDVSEAIARTLSPEHWSGENVGADLYAVETAPASETAPADPNGSPPAGETAPATSAAVSETDLSSDPAPAV